MKNFRYIHILKNVLIYVIVASIFMLIEHIYNIKNFSGNGNVDILTLILGNISISGILDPKSIVFPCGIIIILTTIKSIEIMYVENIAVQYGMKKYIWREQCRIATIISFIYAVTFISMAYLQSYFVLQNFTNSCAVKLQSATIMLCVTMFTGFMSISMFTITLRLWFKNNYTIMISILFLMISYYFKYVHIFANGSTFSLYEINHPISIFYKIIISITICITSYIIGEIKIEKKEFCK